MQDIVPIPYRNFFSLSEGAAILCGYLTNESGRMLNLLDCEQYHYPSEGGEKHLQHMRDGWFPFDVSKIKSDINMSPSRQVKYLRELERKGIITVKRMGLPSSRWISLQST